MSDEGVTKEEIVDECPTCGGTDVDLTVEEYDDGPGELPDRSRSSSVVVDTSGSWKHE